MGGAIAKLIFKNGQEAVVTNYNSFCDIPSIDIDGNKVERLGALMSGKKAVLVVNVATN